MNKLGAEAERIAATFLQQQGLILLENNYSCRYGEIDLIMRDGKTLVFVEVRMRSNHQFGGAAASITPAKQQKLKHTAEHYLQQRRVPACRFDAILMSEPKIEAIEWVKNAFDA